MSGVEPESGMDVDRVASTSGMGGDDNKSLLTWAAKIVRMELIEGLAHIRVDLEQLDARGMTPLQQAVVASQWNVVKYLAVQGAKLDIPDADGLTVLQRVITAGEWDMARYLICKGADVNVKDVNDVYPLECAVRSGKWEMAFCMVQRGGRIDVLSREERYELLEKVIGKTIAYDNIQDAFYNVIHLGNVDLLQMLEIHQKGLIKENNNVLNFDNVLAKTYEKLKLTNVPLFPIMEMEVVKRLVSLRFFTYFNVSEATTESSLEHGLIVTIISPCLEVVKKRIELLCEQIGTLVREYSGVDGKDVDGRFLLVARFVAQNVRALKRQLRSTYNRLPWEEIEFCVSIFILPLEKRHAVHSVYTHVLNKDSLLSYLSLFGETLNEEKFRLTNIDVDSKLPQKTDASLSPREHVAKTILSTNPLFRELYSDYDLIRNVHSLNRIQSYVKKALSVNVDQGNSDHGRLVIERTLQVMGESLKNSLESPNVSDDVHRLLLHSAPTNLREIVTQLRDSISHSQTLKKRIASEDKGDSLFFHQVQNDLRKVDVEIADILYKLTTQAMVSFLRKVMKCDSLPAVKRLYDGVPFTDIGECVRVEEGNTNELAKTKRLVDELEAEMKDEGCFEDVQGWLTKIKDITRSLGTRLKQGQGRFSKGLDAIMTTIGPALSDTCCTLDSIKNVSHTFMKQLVSWPKESANVALLVNLEHIYDAVEHKMAPGVKSDRIKSLLYDIKCTVDFELSRVKGLGTFKATLEKREGVSEREALAKMNDILDEIKRSVNESERKVLQELLKDKIDKYNAKQELVSLFVELLEGLVNKDEPHVKIKYEDLVKKLEMKKNAKDKLNEKFKKCEWSDCKRTIEALGDKYQTLLSSVKNSLISDKDPDLSSSFKRFFSSKTLNQVIDNVLKTNADQFRNYYERRLTQLERLLSTCDTTELLVTKCHQNEEFQSAVDMLVLDLTDILENTLLLGDNRFFLDGSSPLLIGKPLRNYLAHGDPLVDSLPFDTSVATVLTAIELVKEGKDLVTKKNVLIGHRVEAEGPDYLSERYRRSLELIDNQIEMFEGSKEGDLDKVKDCLANGVDLHSRDRKGWTAMHYAAQGDSVGVVKYFLDEGLGVDVDDVHGKNALHVAASSKSEQVVKYLIEENWVDVRSARVANKTLLHYLAEKGCSREVVRLVVAKGARVNARDQLGMSPLHNAALGGQTEVALALLEIGAQVDGRNDGGSTPLHVAAAFSYCEIARALLDRGSDVNARNKDEWTPLHGAALNAREDVSAELLERGADPNAQDCFGQTALHLASAGGKADVVQRLIDQGAGINLADHRGVTPLHEAAQFGHRDVSIILLRHGANINALDHNNQSLLHVAVSGGHVELVETLLGHGRPTDSTADNWRTLDNGKSKANKAIDIEACNDIANTPLSMAAYLGNKDTLEMLLKYGAKTEAKNTFGLTPLHIAASKADTDVVEALLTAGTSVSVRDARGHVPLHLAAVSGRPGNVRVILEYGGVVDERNGESHTPLHSAAKKGDVEVVMALLDGGADVNAKGEHDYTPLHASAAYDTADVAKELLLRGARVDAVLVDGGTPLLCAACFGYHRVVRALLEGGAAVEAVKNDGIRPLHFAALNGHPEVAKQLLRKGALVDPREKDSRTPLHLAAQNGHCDVAVMLVNGGAKVNAVDKIGSTPLHLAVEKGHHDVVEALLINGAGVNEVNVNMIAPLHVSAFNGHLGITKTLLKHGAVVDVTDKNGRTPLYLAVAGSHKDVTVALLEGRADVLARNNHDTVLHRAVTGDDVTVLGLVLHAIHGASKDTPSWYLAINARDAELATPLMWAAAVGRVTAAKLLLDAGADITARNQDGQTALHLAAHNGHADMVDLLVSNEADANVRDVHGMTPYDLARERSSGGSANQDEADLITALLMSVNIEENDLLEDL